MILSLRRRNLGFTLVELAIVLAVAGVLFAGLWRLMAGGNQATRNQSAGAQQLQLVNSIKAYLGSSYGQNYMAGQTAGSSFTIKFPSVAPDGITNTACKTSIDTFGTTTNQNAICDYLPNGFTSGGTTNAYNQTYTSQGLKDSSPAGTPPSAYSFMIITVGGDTIPDSAGGQIASAIGGDGGFVYTNVVCGGSNTFACGAYGTWAVSPTTYGYTYGTAGTPPLYTSGHIATRSFQSTTQGSNLPWLERSTQLQPDPTRNYNTMATDFYMGTGYNMYLSPYDGAAYGTVAGGGNFFADGGKIYLGGNAATIPTTGGGSINLQGGLIQDTSGSGQISFTTPADRTGTSPIVVGTNCTVSTTAIAGLNTDAACKPGISVAGDQTVSGELSANQLYANTFIYQSSDIRLKTDIRPIHNSLDDMLKLKPVDFIFKSNNQRGIGFIAQDVEKVYPELVSQNAAGMKSVNYEGLIAPLVQAVQELKQQNEILQHKLDAQEARQNRFEKDLTNH